MWFYGVPFVIHAFWSSRKWVFIHRWNPCKRREGGVAHCSLFHVIFKPFIQMEHNCVTTSLKVPNFSMVVELHHKLSR
mgnify:CR=1 FL=1